LLGVPVVDPVRDGRDRLVEIVVEYWCGGDWRLREADRSPNGTIRA
jgi:hypothetical protein